MTILLLAALEKQITGSQRRPHQACLIVEGANGPTTLLAEDILLGKGVARCASIAFRQRRRRDGELLSGCRTRRVFWTEKDINDRPTALSEAFEGIWQVAASCR